MTVKMSLVEFKQFKYWRWGQEDNSQTKSSLDQMIFSSVSQGNLVLILLVLTRTLRV